jgi:hypothetical protein
MKIPLNPFASHHIAALSIFGNSLIFACFARALVTIRDSRAFRLLAHMCVTNSRCDEQLGALYGVACTLAFLVDTHRAREG